LKAKREGDPEASGERRGKSLGEEICSHSRKKEHARIRDELTKTIPRDFSANHLGILGRGGEEEGR